jgi:hypothetical protein
MGIISSAFAQSDNPPSILQDTEKSLGEKSEIHIAPPLHGDDYSNYENLDYNVKMHYPKGWSYQEMGNDENFPDTIFQVVFFPTVESVNQSISVSFDIEKLGTTQIDLEEFKDRRIDNLKMDIDPEVKDISTSESTLDGHSAFRMEYSVGTAHHWEKSIDVFSVDNGRLNEVSVLGTPESIEKYSFIIEDMIKSVQFRTPNADEAPDTTAERIS